MCGILSLSTINDDLDQSQFQKALDLQSYRGPDQQAILKISDNTFFGFNRLAIQDLDPRSMQPFEYMGNKLIFNGEIYNFLELKTELESLGHIFTTTGDTEVLIHALSEFGTAALDKLNGIFAFVFYNQKTNQLWAARDGMGVKPLYFYQGKSLIFSSDVASILNYTHPIINQEQLQNTLLADWFMADPNQTLFAGVNQIPAGTIAIFDASSLEKISQTPYFIRDFSQNISDEALVRANYLSTLKKVIQLECQSDAMVGCTISGGTDSTTVLALATSHLLKKQAIIPVFTIKDSGSESDADLQASIETVAALRKIYGDVYDHQIVDLTSPITLEDFKDATKAMGRPVCDPRFIAMTRFFRAMKDYGIKVVLTGQGSDEINYGYHPLYNWPLTSFYTSEMEFSADNLADEFIKIYAEKIAGYNLEFQTKAIASFREHIEKIMAKTAHITDTKKRVTAVLGDTELQNVFSYEDHPSMYSGIEARVPLANTKLVKIADSISPLLQLKNNISGRYFLREALAEAGLPDKIVNRDKFPTPKKQNYVGQLIEILSQNRNAITNSDLIKQVYSKESLAMVLEAQNIDTRNQDTGVNTAHRYGNIEDILLNIIGLWQFEVVYFKN